ncbi:cysteine proteinase [Lophium mytilinum]|uniref:Cysteine proteinase n=1 Tax=Lophium mytilinum TaxID=390894 RepID=A0A6A6QG57_9PEZI|nr:cysteine proteinase [Lophium mytilinum]
MAPMEYYDECSPDEIIDRVQPNPRRKYAQVGDASVYSDEVATVEDFDGWLTDSIIYLYQEILHSKLTPLERDTIYMMSPCTGALYRREYLDICHDTDLLEERFAFLAAASEQLDRRWIVLPVSDGDGFSAVSGTHWSLLIFDLKKEIGTAYYCDSMGTVNEKVAGELVGMMSWLVKKGIRGEKMRTPQQSNVWDCGVYVCWMIDALVNNYMADEGGSLTDSSLVPLAGDINPRQYRRLILKMMAKHLAVVSPQSSQTSSSPSLPSDQIQAQPVSASEWQSETDKELHANEQPRTEAESSEQCHINEGECTAKEPNTYEQPQMDEQSLSDVELDSDEEPFFNKVSTPNEQLLPDDNLDGDSDDDSDDNEDNLDDDSLPSNEPPPYEQLPLPEEDLQT